MLKKFESYWSVIHDILAIASVLDPLYKMDMLEYYFYKLYGIDFDLKLCMIRQMPYDLVLEYQSKKNETSSYRAISLELGKVVDNDANEF